MTELKIIPPLRQDSWGWPAVVNLTLGGAGVGLYLLHGLLSAVAWKLPDGAQLISYQVLAPAAVAFGFLAVSMEAGRPLRAFRLTGNLRNSWMSIESLSGGIFIITALLDWLFPGTLFKALAASAALIFLISQGMMVYRALAVTAWSVRVMPLFFITSGLMSGDGLFLLNTRASGITNVLIAILLTCTLLNLVMWLFYLFSFRKSEFRLAVNAMHTPARLFLIAGAGHVIPILIFVFVALLHNVRLPSPLLSFFGTLCGFLMVTAVAYQKSAIILKASYRRSIVIMQPDVS